MQNIKKSMTKRRTRKKTRNFRSKELQEREGSKMGMEYRNLNSSIMLWP